MPISKVDLDVRWARDEIGARAHSTVVAMPPGYAVWIMDIVFGTHSYSLQAAGSEGGFSCRPKEER